MDALQDLLEDRNDAGMEIRRRIQDAPITILRIATAISENRGRWPAESVTRAATEEVNLVLDVPAVDAQTVGEHVRRLDRDIPGHVAQVGTDQRADVDRGA